MTLIFCRPQILPYIFLSIFPGSIFLHTYCPHYIFVHISQAPHPAIHISFDICRPQILPYIFVLCLLVVIALAVAYRIWRVGIDNFLGFWIWNCRNKYESDFVLVYWKQRWWWCFTFASVMSEQTLATGSRPIRLRLLVALVVPALLVVQVLALALLLLVLVPAPVLLVVTCDLVLAQHLTLHNCGAQLFKHFLCTRIIRIKSVVGA